MSFFQSTQNVTSWGGVLRKPHRVARPGWRDELPHVVGEAVLRELDVLPCGARRSYGDSGLNPQGVLVDTSDLDRILAFDPETGVVRAEGGVCFDTLLRVFVPKGFFLPVTPGTRFVTLAGAIANDVHGKNHHVAGTIGNWVHRIGLLNSDGQKRELSHTDNPDLFRATIGGLGLTGIITWAELQLVPVSGSIMSVETQAFDNLKEFFGLSLESEVRFDYAVSWIDSLSSGPSLGRGIFSRANHAADEDGQPSTRHHAQRTMPFHLPGFLFNRQTVRTFNKAYYWNGKRNSGQTLQPITGFFYPLDAIHHWNRIYGKQGFYQYQSVVPKAVQEDATHEMLRAIAAEGQSSFLSVLKTFGAAKPSPGMLSFPMEGVTLALDFPNKGTKTTALLDRLDAIVKEAKGRLYPAKDGRMSPEMFRLGFPDWEDFAKHVDPNFSSHFWRRVVG